MTLRMVESEAQDFLACLSRCYVAAFQRGDRATADRIREGMEEFERLRRAEPVDHRFVPGAGAECAQEGCGRGADEHLGFGLRLMQGGAAGYAPEGEATTCAGERCQICLGAHETADHPINIDGRRP